MSGFSQTQHGGGGPGGDDLTIEISIEELKQFKIMYSKTLQILNEKWKKCFNRAEPDFINLDDILVQLYWRELQSVPYQNKCNLKPLVKTYTTQKMNCVFDREAKKILRQFFNHPKIFNFLKITEGPENLQEKIDIYRSYLDGK